MHRAAFFLLAFYPALAVATYAQDLRDDPRAADIVRAGALRIGVFPSFQYAKDAAGQSRGLAIEIGNEISKRLAVELRPVPFPSPPEVIACVASRACDVGFMLIDPARASEVDFTPAFVKSDFTYLVPSGSELRGAADVNRPEVRVAAVRNHASTLALVRLASKARPVYADDFEGALALVRAGQADAFASIREVLVQYSPQLPGSRVLEDSYLTNFAGVAVAKGDAERLSFFGDALGDMKRSGSLQRMIAGADLRGVEIVKP